MAGVICHPFSRMEKFLPVHSRCKFHSQGATASCQEDVHLLRLFDRIQGPFREIFVVILCFSQTVDGVNDAVRALDLCAVSEGFSERGSCSAIRHLLRSWFHETVPTS